GPGTVNIIGPYDIVGVVARQLRWDKHIVTAVVLGQLRCPDAADILGQRRTDGGPVDHVLRMPDGQRGIGFEGGKHHVIIFAVFQDARVRTITGNNWIKISAITQVRFALTFVGAGPGLAVTQEGNTQVFSTIFFRSVLS